MIATVTVSKHQRSDRWEDGDQQIALVMSTNSATTLTATNQWRLFYSLKHYLNTSSLGDTSQEYVKRPNGLTYTHKSWICQSATEARSAEKPLLATLHNVQYIQWQLSTANCKDAFHGKLETSSCRSILRFLLHSPFSHQKWRTWVKMGKKCLHDI